MAELRGLGDKLETQCEKYPGLDGTPEGDLKFLAAFFQRNDKFLLGLEPAETISPVCPIDREEGLKRPVTVLNGRRAPNPRISFSAGFTGYLYDKLTGAAKFHILVFGSDLCGPVRERIARFSRQAIGPQGFFTQFGGPATFNLVLIVKSLPIETEKLLQANGEDDDLKNLRGQATVLYDDRSPDEDAHYWYGINHARGAVVVVRPDLLIGVSAWPEEGNVLAAYFEGFLVEADADGHGKLNGLSAINGGHEESNGHHGANGGHSKTNGHKVSNGHT